MQKCSNQSPIYIPKAYSIIPYIQNSEFKPFPAKNYTAKSDLIYFENRKSNIWRSFERRKSYKIELVLWLLMVPPIIKWSSVGYFIYLFLFNFFWFASPTLFRLSVQNWSQIKSGEFVMPRNRIFPTIKYLMAIALNFFLLLLLQLSQQFKKAKKCMSFFDVKHFARNRPKLMSKIDMLPSLKYQKSLLWFVYVAHLLRMYLTNRSYVLNMKIVSFIEQWQFNSNTEPV